MELMTLTLAEAADLIAAGELSPVELARAHLDRIAAIEPRLNCFITLLADAALAQAREAERAIRRGDHRGALHGIPIALKDLYETKGVRTTAGSRFLADHVPDADGAVVEKLRAAGAVLLGKLNMHEWALGVTTDNPHFGACKNPWAPERTPGGSSGGSGAALAAGLCLASYGSDTGGSIRIPASLCGVVGLKPTYGRVSLRGAVPLSWNLDHAGPMARGVRDVAVLLEAVAGYDAADPFSSDVAVEDFLGQLADGVAGWHMALAGGASLVDVDAEVLRALRAAARVFEDLGAEVTEVELTNMPEAAHANGVMTTSDAAAFHHERLQRSPQDFGADVLARLCRGAAYTSGEYVQARRTQSLLRWQFQRWFTDYDVVLTPTTPIAAPVRDGLDAVEAARQLTRFTAPFNLTGLPALSLPCGLTHDGLPIGLQIVGPAWGEAHVLRAGYAYEQAAPWHARTPPL